MAVVGYSVSLLYKSPTLALTFHEVIVIIALKRRKEIVHICFVAESGRPVRVHTEKCGTRLGAAGRRAFPQGLTVSLRKNGKALTDAGESRRFA